MRMWCMFPVLFGMPTLTTIVCTVIILSIMNIPISLWNVRVFIPLTNDIITKSIDPW